MKCHISPLFVVFMDIVLFIELAHALSVEEDQRDKRVDRSLLCEPEAELVTTDFNAVQRLDQDDSKQVRNDKPDHEAKPHESQV